jgi:ubiquinone/menaquinone biosynthesis C-methylase UbiE
MSHSQDQNKKELASTYFVHDRENLEELERLKIQGQLLTSSMGGVLPEQPDPHVFHHVLDIGCGPGDWVIEAAKTYPDMSLAGIDISTRMITYAREEASSHGVADRVEFQVMDTLRMLEFPNASFDLVNLRLGISFMRTWDWPKLLDEFQRVSSVGGVVRITECDMVESNSPSLTYREQLLMQAFYNAGHFFALEKDGLTRQLASLLAQHGLGNVQVQKYILTYRGGTQEGQRFANNMLHGFRTLKGYIQKWTRLPKDYDEISQQALQEMQQPDFVANWRYVTAWGTVVNTRRLSRLERDR